jgi:hypothetical protein
LFPMLRTSVARKRPFSGLMSYNGVRAGSAKGVANRFTALQNIYYI